MHFTLRQKSGDTQRTVSYQNLFAIGYAGRNMEKTLEHIRELERDLGVAAPQKIPTIFQCATLLLTQEESFVAIGGRSCGEVEYVIVTDASKVYIGVGSDHTDRELEGKSVPKAKQICAKPIGPILWDYEELKSHWDSIQINSWQTIDGQEVAYQKGTLADILPVETILKELAERIGDIGNSVIFSGTVPALNGFKFGDHFRCEMVDPVLNRSISCEYSVLVVTEDER